MDYLIPANTKKSMLWFGLFTPTDLIIFGVSIGVTLILLMVLNISSLPVGLLAITPGLVGSFLVFPVPNYHNMITIIKNVYIFYTTRQKFVWKGWCVSHGDDEK
jgi:hypothetical protein